MKKTNKFIDFVAKQNYIKELSIPEHIILWTNVVLSLTFFIVQLAWLHTYDQWPTWLSFLASVISIFAVMGGAKQRIICPFLGMIASILLAIIAVHNRLFGTLITYCFNFAMQLTTLIIWYRVSNNKVSIQPKHWKWWWVLIYIVGFIALSLLFAWIETFPNFQEWWFNGEKQPLHLLVFDSMLLMFTIAAAFPLFKRYDFVWITYIIADAAMAAMWITKGVTHTDVADQFNDWTMLVCGLSMLATCIVGLINWMKTSKNKA